MTTWPACGSVSTGVPLETAAVMFGAVGERFERAAGPDVGRPGPGGAAVARGDSPDAADVRRGDGAEHRLQRPVRQPDEPRLAGLPARERRNRCSWLAARGDGDRRQPVRPADRLEDEVEDSVGGTGHGDGLRGRSVDRGQAREGNLRREYVRSPQHGRASLGGRGAGGGDRDGRDCDQLLNHRFPFQNAAVLVSRQ